MKPHSRRREEGTALLITMLLILLMGALALDAIDHSGAESVSGARSRSTARALHATDGGMQLALSRLSQTPANTDPIDISMGGFSVQSRTRADGGPLDLESQGAGPPPDGYGMNVGDGYTSQLFKVDITAVGLNGSTVEIQSKLYIFAGSPDGY